MNLKIILLLVLLIFSCQKKSNVDNPIKINKSPDKNDYISDEDKNFQLNINIPSNYSVKEVYNLQLGSNNFYVNQIVLVKKKGEKFLRVLFVDAKLKKNLEYSDKKDIYFLAWEDKLLATNIKDLNFYSLDLEKDGIPELVFVGKDDQKRSVINILKSNNNNIYKTVFSRSIYGFIQTEENKDHTFSILFHINKTHTTEIYSWDPNSLTYKKTGIKKFTKSNLEESLKKEEDIFKNLWIKKTKNNVYVLEFNKNLKYILVLENDGKTKLEDEYKITSSINLNNRFIFYLENKFINIIIDEVNFYLKNPDTAYITFKEKNNLNGTYKKLINLKEFKRQKKTKKEKIKLNGLYSNNEGLSMVFSNNTFTLREKNKSSKGTYIIYKTDKDIIDLQTINNKKIERKTYIIEYTEEKDENINIRKIKLIPIKILVSGTYETKEKPLYLEQVVITKTK